MPPLEPYQIVAPVVACLVIAALSVRMVRYRFAVLGFGAVVGYAMIQDQVSVRLCPEYFTVLHNPVPGVTDPTLLGLCWGFLGGWWGGLVLGYSAGLCAALGPRPPLRPRELLLPLTLLLVVVGTVTTVTGLSVWRHADLFGVALSRGVAEAVPPERHRELLTVACYHLVAYVTSAIGSVVLCLWVRAERQKRARAAEEPVRGVSCC